MLFYTVHHRSVLLRGLRSVLGAAKQSQVLVHRVRCFSPSERVAPFCSVLCRKEAVTEQRGSLAAWKKINFTRWEFLFDVPSYLPGELGFEP